MKKDFLFPLFQCVAMLSLYANGELFGLNNASLEDYQQNVESNFSGELGINTQFRSLEKIPAFVIFPNLDSIDRKSLAIAENSFLTCLQKTGKVSWMHLIQKGGIDVSVFSNPPLILSLNQIIDTHGAKLPVYRLSLEFESLAKLSKQDFSCSGIFWKRSCYISQNDLINRLPKSIQLLFSFFLTDYQKANPDQSIPEFYLVEENFTGTAKPRS